MQLRGSLLDVVTYLVFAEAVLLHDFTIGIVIRINLLSFTFERINMHLGVVSVSSRLMASHACVFNVKKE